MIEPEKTSSAARHGCRRHQDHEPARALAARLLDGAGAAYVHPVRADLASPGPVLHGRDDLGNLLVLARPDRGSGWERVTQERGTPVHVSVIHEAPYAWLKVRLADLFLHGHARRAAPLVRRQLAVRASDSPHLAHTLRTWRGAELYVVEPTEVRVRTPLSGAVGLSPDDVRNAEADAVARDAAHLLPEVLALGQESFRSLVTARARKLQRPEWGVDARFDAAYPVAVDGWGLTALAVRRGHSYLVRVPFPRPAAHAAAALAEIRGLLRR